MRLHFHSFVDDTCAFGFGAEALSVARGKKMLVRNASGEQGVERIESERSSEGAGRVTAAYQLQKHWHRRFEQLL